MANFPSSSSHPNQQEPKQNPQLLSTTSSLNPSFYHNPDPNAVNPYHHHHPNPNPNPGSNPNPVDNAVWFAQDKEFEGPIIESSQWDESNQRRILSGGRTAAEAEEHYNTPVDLIGAGQVLIPSDDRDDDGWCHDWGLAQNPNAFNEVFEEEEEEAENLNSSTSSTPTAEGGRGGGEGFIERKKGAKWTEDEHKLLILGLEKYGKGDWKSISRNFVTTRSPTQVASHAQKFYNRLESGPKARRRSSIHDIKKVDSESLADLFRRGVINASKIDDDSMADLVRQGLVPPNWTSTGALLLPPADASTNLRSNTNVVADYTFTGAQHDRALMASQLDVNTISSYAPANTISSYASTTIQREHAVIGSQLDANTFSDSCLQREEKNFANCTPMGIQDGLGMGSCSSSHLDENTIPYYTSTGVQQRLNTSSGLQLHANTIPSYTPTGIQQHNLNPGSGSSSHLDENTIPYYTSTGVQHGSNNTILCYTPMGIQQHDFNSGLGLQSDADAISGYTSTGVQQGNHPDVFPNHVLADQYPNPPSFISPDRILAGQQSGLNMIPGFNSSEHHEYYGQMSPFLKGQN